MYKPFIIVLALAAAVATPAHAQIFNSATTVGTEIANFLTGGFARAIGVIAFAIFGILAALGRMDWRMAAAIMVGLVCLFGGATFVQEIEGIVN